MRESLRSRLAKRCSKNWQGKFTSDDRPRPSTPATGRLVFWTAPEPDGEVEGGECRSLPWSGEGTVLAAAFSWTVAGEKELRKSHLELSAPYTQARTRDGLATWLHGTEVRQLACRYRKTGDCGDDLCVIDRGFGDQRERPDSLGPTLARVGLVDGGTFESPALVSQMRFDVTDFRNNSQLCSADAQVRSRVFERWILVLLTCLSRAARSLRISTSFHDRFKRTSVYECLKIRSKRHTFVYKNARLINK